MWLIALVGLAALVAWLQWRRPTLASRESTRPITSMRPMPPIGYSCASRGPGNYDPCCAAAVAAGEDLMDRGCEEYCNRTRACTPGGP